MRNVTRSVTHPVRGAFARATEPWPGGFRVTLTEPQVDALLALDARDGGSEASDPGPTRTLTTWRALRDIGLVGWPPCPRDRPAWTDIEVTEPGAGVIHLLHLAGRSQTA